MTKQEETNLFFRFKCFKGLKERGLADNSIYVNQLNYEIGIITSLDFADYFLVVQDILDWARDKKIPIGNGRGCLHPTTSIITSEGIPVEIEKIRAGEYVYTKNGSIKLVKNTFRYPCNEQLIRISCYYGDNNKLILTKDHKVLVDKQNKITNKTKILQGYKNDKPYKKPIWIPANEIEVGDAVVVPKIKRQIRDIDYFDLSLFIPENRKDLYEVGQDYILEYISIGGTNKKPLSKRGICRDLKISCNCLNHVIARKKTVRTNTKNKINKFLLNKYNISIEDFIDNYQNKTINKIPRYIKVDKQFCYFWGLFLSDGWITKKRNSIGLCDNSDNLQTKCKDIITNIFNIKTSLHKHKTKKLNQWIAYSFLIKNFIYSHIPNYNFTAPTKDIPDFLLSLPDDKIIGLIDGLMDGDGSCTDRDKFTSSSFNLANKLRYLCWSLGKPASLGYDRRVDRREEYKNRKIAYSVLIARNKNNINRHFYTDDQYIYQRVFKKELVDYQGEVFDLEINDQEEQNFLTSNCIVHNSSAGSLVAYVLNITQLDPIRYKLIFERFLNPERVSWPDIDVDLCELRREEVIQYIKQKYGEECVANIGTFGSMKAKGAIRDVTRTLGWDYSDGDKLARLVLEPVAGKTQDLEICYKQVPELAKARESNSVEGDILRWAEKFENRIRSTGVHASGFLIADRPIFERVPLIKSKDGSAATQFEMNTVEKCGFIKFDFLGLRTLTILQRCINLIEERTGKRIDLNSIPVDDEGVYITLASGDVNGVFQMDAGQGLRDLVIKAAPKSIEEISDIIALFRPGPLQNGMLDEYVAIKNGSKKPEYLIPELQPILESTFGLILYQEQVLEICKQLAGYTLGEADVMRKALGKKLEKEMNLQKEKFISGCIKNNISEQIATNLFETIYKFADYSFNRAHSAAYALTSYHTAYLKTYYPFEYMSACMTCDMDNSDKITKYIESCQEKGIKILPPDINESNFDFTISKDNRGIRFGLGAIKNLGEVNIKKIIEERKIGRFETFSNFLENENLQLNKRQIETLILSGCFDSITDYTRKSLIQNLDIFREYISELKKYNTKYKTFLKKQEAYNKREQEIKNGAKKKSFQVPVEPVKPILNWNNTSEDYSSQEKLEFERDLLGYYISGHPLDNLPEMKSNHVLTIKKLNSLDNNCRVWIIGIIALQKEITTKIKKQKMCFMRLEDKTGTIDAVIPPSEYERLQKYLDNKRPMAFDAWAEIIETEETKIVKLKIQDIRELKSIKESEFKFPSQLKIQLTSEELPQFTKIINKSKKEQSVKLIIEVVSKSKNMIWQLETNDFFLDKNSLNMLRQYIKE